MKCQICNKNEANIFFTQIVNNEKLVLQMCSECAEKRGLSVKIEHPGFVSINGIADKKNAKDKSNSEFSLIICPSCGLSLSDFKSSGLFGCDDCHISFEGHIYDLLKELQCSHDKKCDEEVIFEKDNSEKNDNKEPDEKQDKLKLLKKLRIELKKCIESEDYEQAALLRDRITEVEKEALSK